MQDCSLQFRGKQHETNSSAHNTTKSSAVLPTIGNDGKTYDRNYNGHQH